MRGGTLELLIVALSLGVVQTHAGTEFTCDALVPDELVVLLVVVIGLVLVIAVWITIVVITHDTARVIAPPVQALLILRRVVPGMVGLFNTVPSDEFYHRVVAEIASLQQVRIELR